MKGLDARGRWVLGIVCLATALVILSINLPSVFLPGRELGASFAEQQWVVNAYALSLAALLLTAGSLADRLGRKRVFVWGLVWFLLSSLLLLRSSKAVNKGAPPVPRRFGWSSPHPRAGLPV